MIAPLDLLAAANEIGVRAHVRMLAEQKWTDSGTPGFAYVIVPANTIFGRAILKAGKGRRAIRGLIVHVDLPPGVRRVQSSSVNHAATRAMADHLIANGVEGVDVHAWVD